MTLPAYDLIAAVRPVPQLMGILNVTPDSFSDGGQLAHPEQVVQRAQQHVAEGASWLDLGAESTRPGAAPISVAEELRRLLPALRALKAARLSARISVDTRRAAVAAEALALGADAINDVSALGDSDMAPLVAQAQVPIIVMHYGGPAPWGGAQGAHYDDVVQEVGAFLQNVASRALEAGIAPPNIWFDPGLGFGKTPEHNLALLQQLHQLVALGQPIALGPSRKRFLQRLVGKPSQGCDEATAAACCVATLQGVHLLRVHAPGAVKDAVRVAAALRSHGQR